MKAVQDALASLGVSVYADVYKPQQAGTPESSYVTYVTRMYEDDHWDDECHGYKVFVYMNLWTKSKPYTLARQIRAAMKAAGFSMEEEATGATSGESYYAEGLKLFNVRWTWVIWEDAEDGSQDGGL